MPQLGQGWAGPAGTHPPHPGRASPGPQARSTCRSGQGPWEAFWLCVGVCTGLRGCPVKEALSTRASSAPAWCGVEVALVRPGQ